MKIDIALGQNVRIAFEIPSIAYVALAAIAVPGVIFMFGVNTPNQAKSAKFGLHEIELHVDVNRTAKSDQLLPTFPERFGFDLSQPPTNPGPMVREQGPHQRDPAKNAPPAIKLADDGYFYQTRAKAVGAPDDEVELEVIKAKCSWPHQFPPPCYYPQNERWKLPIYMFDEPLKR